MDDNLIKALSKLSILPKELGRFQCFLDNRPLTDETLKELGFTQTEPNLWSNGEIKFGLYSGKAPVKIDIIPVYKTVGGVKLLIEALKGDE